MKKQPFLEDLYLAAARLPGPAADIVRISVIMRRAIIGFILRRPMAANCFSRQGGST